VPKTRSKFLIFCDVYKGKVDPYRGVEVATGGDIVKYLRGAINLKDQSIPARLRYCFDFLENSEPEIDLDASREFAAADYKHCRNMANHLPADRIVGWLQNPKTPQNRLGFYALLLGHCGNEKHAQILRSLLEDSRIRKSAVGFEGVLKGYTILKPRKGWQYVSEILKNPRLAFRIRYAALQAVRFFWEMQPDVVARKDLLRGVCLLLDQKDMADLPVNYLCRWKVWTVADRVIALAEKPWFKEPIIHRAVLRYALSFPKPSLRVFQFLRAERRRDHEFVHHVEECLKEEKTTEIKSPHHLSS
jgi:hypothetical protein